MANSLRIRSEDQKFHMMSDFQHDTTAVSVFEYKRSRPSPMQSRNTRLRPFLHDLTWQSVYSSWLNLPPHGNVTLRIVREILKHLFPNKKNGPLEKGAAGLLRNPDLSEK